MSPFSAHTAEIRRLVALQDYQHSPWPDLVSLFKSTTLHFAHVADRVDESKLEKVWLNGLGESVTLEEMIRDYERHLGLHLEEVEELLKIK